MKLDGNTVIITGRDPQKLERVAQALKGVHAIASDVRSPEQIAALLQRVQSETSRASR
jgi:short-subunit dehydrogenase involved in D-alanine esterification of teichoic acids